MLFSTDVAESAGCFRGYVQNPFTGQGKYIKSI